MSIEELIIEGKKSIHKDQAIIVLSSLLNINYFDIYLSLDKKVDEEIVSKYRKIVQAIMENKPIQYLLGSTSFYGYNFKVNENVLVPRFETELLVDKAKEYIKKYFDDVNIVDIGTGSGVIAIVLKLFFPDSKVSAVDISAKALEVAKENSSILGASVNFIQGNMLDNLKDKYDILISNPPYLVRNGNIEQIVVENEPEIALYGGEDGKKYYREILKNASRVLNEKNMIAFEIGYDQKDSICEMAKKAFPNSRIECYKDLNGYDRYIFIFNNCE